MSVDAMRREYDGRPLQPEAVGGDPIGFFRRWFDEAAAAVGEMAGAMHLATVGGDGAPSLRVVLLRGIGDDGLRFFTHTASRKGREIGDEPRVALCFYWEPLDRQVRIEGIAEPLPEAVVDAYFSQRPRASRLAAAAAVQSEPLADRSELERRFEALRVEVGEGEVPRPPAWGGYVVRPTVLEFWQGRASRLHDRVRCRRREDGWLIDRLAP